MAMTFRIPRWRAHVALTAGFILATVGMLTESRCDSLADWIARGVTLEK